MRFSWFVLYVVFYSAPLLAQSQPQSWTESTTVDFEDGILSNVVVTEEGDGEIIFPYPFQRMGPDRRADDDTLRFADPLIGGVRSSNGSYVISWVEEYERVLAQNFDAAGNALTDTLRVNEEYEGERIRRFVDVAMLDDGTFLVIWEAQSTSERGYRTRGKIYTASGQIVGDSFTLEAHSSQTNAEPVAIANQSDQTFWILQSYGSFSEGKKIRVYPISPSGEASAPAFSLSAPMSSKYEQHPDLAFSDDGGFMAVWTGSSQATSSYSDIYARRFNAQGKPVAPSFKVNNDTGLVGQTRPSVQFDNDSNYLIAWMDARRYSSSTGAEFDIYGQFYLASGEKLGSNFLISRALAGEAFFPDITFADSMFEVSWISGYNRPVYVNKWRFLPVFEGIYTSSVFDTGDVGTSYKSIIWEKEANEGTSVVLQLRSARTMHALNNSPWLGPSDEATYKESSGKEDINPVHNFDRFIQYRVLFKTDDVALSPVLKSVSITYEASAIPKTITLWQNYPNPFRGFTTFRFSIPDREHVTLELYDMLGRKVENVFSRVFQAGNHEVSWRASTVASGSYVYVLRTQHTVQTNTLILVN